MKWAFVSTTSFPRTFVRVYGWPVKGFLVLIGLGVLEENYVCSSKCPPYGSIGGIHPMQVSHLGQPKEVVAPCRYEGGKATSFVDVTCMLITYCQTASTR